MSEPIAKSRVKRSAFLLALLLHVARVVIKIGRKRSAFLLALLLHVLPVIVLIVLASRLKGSEQIKKPDFVELWSVITPPVRDYSESKVESSPSSRLATLKLAETQRQSALKPSTPARPTESVSPLMDVSKSGLSAGGAQVAAAVQKTSPSRAVERGQTAPAAQADTADTGRSRPAVPESQVANRDDASAPALGLVRAGAPVDAARATQSPPTDISRPALSARDAQVTAAVQKISPSRAVERGQTAPAAQADTADTGRSRPAVPESQVANRDDASAPALGPVRAGAPVDAARTTQQDSSLGAPLVVAGAGVIPKPAVNVNPMVGGSVLPPVVSRVSQSILTRQGLQGGLRPKYDPESLRRSMTYAEFISAYIAANIQYNENNSEGAETRVLVKVNSDGAVVARKIINPSELKSWDAAVLKAIDRTAKIPPDTDGKTPPDFVVIFRRMSR
jgi:colicin import membrane protein